MSFKNYFPRMPRMSLTLRLLVVLSLSFGAARPQSRQSKETQKRADDEEVVTVRSHLVNVDVSVKDKKGNYVTDLKAEDDSISLFERADDALYRAKEAGKGQSVTANSGA